MTNSNEIIEQAAVPAIPSDLPYELRVRMDEQTFPRIRQMAREKAVAEVAKIVYGAFMYRNQKADEDTVKFTAVALVDEILRDEWHLGLCDQTIPEIDRAIKRGVLGVGREMFGISVSSLYALLADYAKGEGANLQKRAEAIHKEIEDARLAASGFSAKMQAVAGEMIKHVKQ